MATVRGIDVSYWQSGIDWPKARAMGNRFVMIKATEGATYTDPTFEENWSGSKKAGLLRGAYSFFHPNIDPKKQAEYFIEVCNGMNDLGDLPPALDLEVTDGITKDKIISKAKIWLDQVEKAFGRRPFIYSSVDFLQTNFSEIGGGPPAWVKEYPLWLAWYPNHYVPDMDPIMPNGWFKWTIWQYSDKGTVNGINAPVDLDVFNGTLEDVYKFAGAKMEVATQKPKSHTIAAGDTFETIANKYGVTLRELVATNPQLLKIGDKLTVPNPVAIPQDAGNTTKPASGSGTSAGIPAERKYTVKAGDTLSAIAVKFGTTVPKIVAANNLANPNLISVGQVLIIP